MLTKLQIEAEIKSCKRQALGFVTAAHVAAVFAIAVFTAAGAGPGTVALGILSAVAAVPLAFYALKAWAVRGHFQGLLSGY